MPELEFDGHPMAYGADGEERPDTAVVVSEYELRTLASFLPPDRALPIAVRGNELVIVPGLAQLASMVELCRMRDVRDAPRYPQAPGSADAAQEATGPQEPAATRARPALDEALFSRFEAFLGDIDLDPAMWDHQTLASELVGAVMGKLREHDILNVRQVVRNWYFAERQTVRAAVARAIGNARNATASTSTLRECKAIGQQVMIELDNVVDGRA